jgi:hypothetical protein
LESVHALSPEHAAAVRNWRADVNRRAKAGQQDFEEAAGDSDLASAGRVAGQFAGSAPFSPLAFRAGRMLASGASDLAFPKAPSRGGFSIANLARELPRFASASAVQPPGPDSEQQHPAWLSALLDKLEQRFQQPQN